MLLASRLASFKMAIDKVALFVLSQRLSLQCPTEMVCPEYEVNNPMGSFF